MEKIISLKQFKIQRPEKILYDYPISDVPNLFNQIKSTSLRNHLKKIDSILEENNISWEYRNLTKQDYLDWLPYYKEKMDENNYIIRAEKVWYEEESKKGWKIKGVFLYKNNKIIGSSIIALKDNVASFAFKSSDRINFHKHSIGSLMELLKLREVSKEGNISTVITRSPNAFGVFNTLGYLDLRLRFGYKPRLNLYADFSDTVPVNGKGFVLFYGVHKKELSLYFLQSKDQKNEEYIKNIPVLSGIPFKNIYYE